MRPIGDGPRLGGGALCAALVALSTVASFVAASAQDSWHPVRVHRDPAGYPRYMRGHVPDRMQAARRASRDPRDVEQAHHSGR